MAEAQQVSATQYDTVKVGPDRSTPRFVVTGPCLMGSRAVKDAATFITATDGSAETPRGTPIWNPNVPVETYADKMRRIGPVIKANTSLVSRSPLKTYICV